MATYKDLIAEAREWAPCAMTPEYQAKLINGLADALESAQETLEEDETYMRIIERRIAVLKDSATSPGERKHTTRNIVNAILEGAVECGAYELRDMGKRQAFNDVADKFVLSLIGGDKA